MNFPTLNEWNLKKPKSRHMTYMNPEQLDGWRKLDAMYLQNQKNVLNQQYWNFQNEANDPEDMPRKIRKRPNAKAPWTKSQMPKNRLILESSEQDDSIDGGKDDSKNTSRNPSRYK